MTSITSLLSLPLDASFGSSTLTPWGVHTDQHHHLEGAGVDSAPRPLRLPTAHLAGSSTRFQGFPIVSEPQTLSRPPPRRRQLSSCHADLPAPEPTKFADPQPYSGPTLKAVDVPLRSREEAIEGADSSDVVRGNGAHSSGQPSRKAPALTLGGLDVLPHHVEVSGDYWGGADTRSSPSPSSGVGSSPSGSSGKNGARNSFNTPVDMNIALLDGGVLRKIEEDEVEEGCQPRLCTQHRLGAQHFFKK